MKLYLDVTFRSNARVKHLGAKWDRKAKKWYVPTDVPPDIFGPWIPGHGSWGSRTYLAVEQGDVAVVKKCGGNWDVESRCWFVQGAVDEDLAHLIPDIHFDSEHDVVQLFSSFLRSLGFDLGEDVLMSGTKIRSRVDGDKRGQRSGQYVGYIDGVPAGYAINYRTGQKASWKSTRPSLSRQQYVRLNAQIAQSRFDKGVRRRLIESKAEEAAKLYLSSASSDVSQHHYAVRKGIKSRPGLFCSEDGSNLCIPLYSIDKKLRTLQFIAMDGSKRFLADGRKEGCFHVVDQSRISEGGEVLICEGYATGCSLRDVTGLPVIVAMDAGNLETVARCVRTRYPGIKIVVAGDDDHSSERGNRGRHAAAKASLAVNAIGVLPRFSGQAKAGMSDFWDLISGFTVIQKAHLGSALCALAKATDPREVESLDYLQILSGMGQSSDYGSI